MGRRSQTKNSGNSFWSNVLYHGRQEPSVTTDSLEMTYSAGADVVGTVSGQGSVNISEYGFVWAEHDNPTIADNKVAVGTDSFLGQFSTRIDSLPPFELISFAAYATNSVGTVYGAVLSDTVQICLAAGTMIDTPYGPVAIEYISYTTDLSVWNFDEGIPDEAKPVWIAKPFTYPKHSVARFSDGTELKTVADGRGHRIFNAERGMFTHMMSDNTPVGTTTVRNDGKSIVLLEKDVVEEETTFYNVITDYHINVYANSILTSTGLNNIYPIENMRFIKENRKPRCKTEFGVHDSLFEGLRLAEQPGGLRRKIQMMERRQLPVEFTSALSS